MLIQAKLETRVFGISHYMDAFLSDIVYSKCSLIQLAEKFQSPMEHVATQEVHVPVEL